MVHQAPAPVAPLVSILMATHNGSAYIGEALRSVVAQTYTNWELVVVDDASSDDVEAKVRAHIVHNLRYIRSTHRQGLTKSLNKAIDQAQGKYLVRLDDDDIWLAPTKLKQQVDLLEHNEALGLCGTQYQVINEQGAVLFSMLCPITDAEIRAKILHSNPFVHSGVCIRAAALAAVGGHYNEKLTYAQDYELWLRIGTRYTLANLPLLGVAKRQRNTAVSTRHHRQQFKFFLATAYRFRRLYPGFYRNLPIYIREGLLNIVPKSFFHTLSQLYRHVRRR